MLILNINAGKAYETISDYGATAAVFVLVVLLFIKLITVLKSNALRKMKLQNVLSRPAPIGEICERDDEFVVLEPKAEQRRAVRRIKYPPLYLSALTVLAAEKLIDEYIEAESKIDEQNISYKKEAAALIQKAVALGASNPTIDRD